MNHDSLNLQVVLPGLPSVNQLGHRDQQALRQMVEQFSVACCLIRQRGVTPSILETGSGLSTEVFARLTSPESGGGSVVSIDFRGSIAVETNSRSTLAGPVVGLRSNVELIDAPSISLPELLEVYGPQAADIAQVRMSKAFEHLDPFLDFSMDDRRVSAVTPFLGGYPSSARLRQYMTHHGVANNPLLESYRSKDDEFEMLRRTETPSSLESLLKDRRPNLVFLDSGEFSTLVEFLIVDRISPAGTLLLVQDILFPKSIKGFIVGGIVAGSPTWRVAWIDRTTAQGMILAEKLVD